MKTEDESNSWRNSGKLTVEPSLKSTQKLPASPQLFRGFAINSEIKDDMMIDEIKLLCRAMMEDVRVISHEIGKRI